MKSFTFYIMSAVLAFIACMIMSCGSGTGYYGYSVHYRSHWHRYPHHHYHHYRPPARPPHHRPPRPPKPPNRPPRPVQLPSRR